MTSGFDVITRRYIECLDRLGLVARYVLEVPVKWKSTAWVLASFGDTYML